MSVIKQARVNQVFECIVNASGAGLTAQEVASCVELKAGGWLKAILHELEAGGWIRHEMVIIKTGAGLREGARYYATEKVAQS